MVLLYDRIYINDIPKKEVKHGKVLDYNSNVVVILT